eukprot:TRINITY_DN2380_c0_g1_i1.p1 TRINITY_DN2380_c0_g1~~TRINITY_DN2380_c0_g1_i1.p1  ORF type:complete len:563 (-),score=94.78 TRINITY_DN2380_c0_g1_i1:1050-2738(-)
MHLTCSSYPPGQPISNNFLEQKKRPSHLGTAAIISFQHPAIAPWGSEPHQTMRIFTPWSAISFLICGMVYSPQCTMEAMSAAEALPLVSASAMCCGLPAPPEAMTGMDTFSTMSRVRSSSQPSLVPSASMELRQISPAPRDSPFLAHSTASRPVYLRPPCTTISQPEGICSDFSTCFTSMPKTTHWDPNAAAPSLMTSGFFTAPELTLTFSAPARSTARMSSRVLMPPPTEKGMKILEATSLTTSRKMLRPSWEAVMSQNTISSAPSSQYMRADSTGSPMSTLPLNLTPLVRRPFRTSRQGIMRLLSTGFLLAVAVEVFQHLQAGLAGFFRVELCGPEAGAAVDGTERESVAGGAYHVLLLGVGEVGVDEVEFGVRIDAFEQRAILGEVDFVPAHMRDADGVAVLIFHGGLEHHAFAGHDAEGFGVILHRVVEQNLTPYADAQERLARGDMILDDLIQARGDEFVHGRAGSAHARENKALGLGNLLRVGGDGVGDFEVVQGAANTGLVAGLVLQDGEHWSPPDKRPERNGSVWEKDTQQGFVRCASLPWWNCMVKLAGNCAL